MLALVAASSALNASKIPFTTPVAAVRVGRIQDKWVLNPTFQQLAYSDMEIVVAGSHDSIMMVEGGALEVVRRGRRRGARPSRRRASAS